MESTWTKQTEEKKTIHPECEITGNADWRSECGARNVGTHENDDGLEWRIKCRLSFTWKRTAKARIFHIKMRSYSMAARTILRNANVEFFAFPLNYMTNVTAFKKNGIQTPGAHGLNGMKRSTTDSERINVHLYFSMFSFYGGYSYGFESLCSRSASVSCFDSSFYMHWCHWIPYTSHT